MSRTDKDMPVWVRAPRWEPFHFNCEYDIPNRRWQKVQRDRQCDLPKRPPTRRQITNHGWPNRHWKHQKNCSWEPDINAIYPSGLQYNPRPPKWFIDHVWYDTERRRSRDECIQARKESRATGDVEIVPTILQHRHQATWLYW